MRPKIIYLLFIHKLDINFVKFIQDESFDSIQEQLDWLEAVCNKHRERYRLENEKYQIMEPVQ